MVKGSPICILTATITPEELTKVKQMIGRRKEPLLVAQGPIQSHSKISFIRRPSSEVPLLGKTRADGSFQSGDLDYLRVLVLDEFIHTVKNGLSNSNFPKSVIFFRYQKFNFSQFPMVTVLRFQCSVQVC